MTDDVMTAAKVRAERARKRFYMTKMDVDFDDVVAPEIAEAVREAFERCAVICDAYAKEAWGETEEQCAAEKLAAEIRKAGSA